MIQDRSSSVALMKLAGACLMHLRDVGLVLPEARHVLGKHGQPVTAQKGDNCGRTKPATHDGAV
ncbi:MULTISPECIES: hypothetical protein [Variovorax]|uniref:hypothetical protein n=1 Tax=Variovorax TaxID=34072 RepID=UPI00115F78B2|nr:MULTISPECIES: hypothetical protein [Variovorax]UVH60772.1 hypothetical protein NWF24_15535 [Variovorax paradoxus]